MADEDDEWKFSVDEVGDDAEDGDAGDAGADDATDDATGGSDGSGVTILGGGDDGPTVKVGGPKTAAEELTGDEDEGGNVAGALTPQMPVERGTPDAENTLFVALGVFLTLLVIASVPYRLDATAVLSIAAAVAVVSGGLYAMFRTL
ncbi:MAG: hypothetical protein ABEJ85_03790 [Haloarculaceae archaeon]